MEKKYSCLSEKILLEGNVRFVNEKLACKDFSLRKRSELFKNGQHPIAVVIACSDSRVSPEIIFDVGLGDIFVIRNAGNIVDDTTVENVEFAIKEFGIPYILVLAHEGCGAAKAAVEKAEKLEQFTGFIRHFEPIIDKIHKNSEKDFLEGELAEKVEDENLGFAVERLMQSEILNGFTKQEKLRIAKGKYYLETGEVKML